MILALGFAVQGMVRAFRSTRPAKVTRYGEIPPTQGPILGAATKSTHSTGVTQ